MGREPIKFVAESYNPLILPRVFRIAEMVLAKYKYYRRIV